MSETKKCSMCNEVKPLTDFYSQKKFGNKRGEYTYYNPECKQCTIKRSDKWAKDNPERFKVNNLKTALNYKNRNRERVRDYARQRREKGLQRQWAKENKDKVKQYNLYREQNKRHEITKQEWEDCKRYFNYSCAYCGISEKESKKLYNNYLHKEHVEHFGSNRLDNCVPSCKKCNSSKHDKLLEEWYTKESLYIDFDELKLEKLNRWVNEDHKKYILR